METPKIFDSELRFCEILWEHQPVRSSELAHLCTEKLGWKKSTTYTVIKRSEEHTSELQSPTNLVCRLLLEKNFFNDTATTEIYTLSLHDALPICFDVFNNFVHFILSLFSGCS